MPVEPLWFGFIELSSAQHWFKAPIDKTGDLAESRAAKTLSNIDLDIETIFDGHDQVEDIEAVKTDFVNGGIGRKHCALRSVSLSKLNNLFEYSGHDIPLAVSRGIPCHVFASFVQRVFRMDELFFAGRRQSFLQIAPSRIFALNKVQNDRNSGDLKQ